IKARTVWPLEHRHCIGAAPLDTHVPCLPAEAISFAVADDGAPALADDHAAGLLNHDPIALAHFPAGAAHVIESARIVLGRWGHKLALRLRRGGAGRWGRRLQRGRSDGGRSDRLLRRRGTRRLADRTADAALIRLLRAWRRCRRLRTRCRWRLHLTFLRTARRLRTRCRWRLHLTFLSTAWRLLTGCRWRLHLTFLSTAWRLRTRCRWRLHLTFLRAACRRRARCGLGCLLPSFLLLFLPLARSLRWRLLIFLLLALRRLRDDKPRSERRGVD